MAVDFGDNIYTYYHPLYYTYLHWVAADDPHQPLIGVLIVLPFFDDNTQDTLSPVGPDYQIPNSLKGGWVVAVSWLSVSIIAMVKFWVDSHGGCW